MFEQESPATSDMSAATAANYVDRFREEETSAGARLAHAAKAGFDRSINNLVEHPVASTLEIGTGAAVGYVFALAQRSPGVIGLGAKVMAASAALGVVDMAGRTAAGLIEDAKAGSTRNAEDVLSNAAAAALPQTLMILGGGAIGAKLGHNARFKNWTQADESALQRDFPWLHADVETRPYLGEIPVAKQWKWKTYDKLKGDALTAYDDHLTHGPTSLTDGKKLGDFVNAVTEMVPQWVKNTSDDLRGASQTNLRMFSTELNRLASAHELPPVTVALWPQARLNEAGAAAFYSSRNLGVVLPEEMFTPMRFQRSTVGKLMDYSLHELQHHEQTYVVARALADTMGLGSRANVLDSLKLKLAFQSTTSWPMSMESARDIINTRNGMRLSPEQTERARTLMVSTFNSGNARAMRYESANGARLEATYNNLSPSEHSHRGAYVLKDLDDSNHRARKLYSQYMVLHEMEAFHTGRLARRDYVWSLRAPQQPS